MTPSRRASVTEPLALARARGASSGRRQGSISQGHPVDVVDPERHRPGLPKADRPDVGAVRIGDYERPSVRDHGETICEEPDWYYHFYPATDRDRVWFGDAAFEIVDDVEGVWVNDAYAYRHLIARAT